MNLANALLDLYDLLILTFSKDGKLADLAALQKTAGLTDAEWEDLLQYTVQVLSNLVNYKSFGFSKIVPRVLPDKFEAAVKASGNESAIALFNKVCNDPDPGAFLLTIYSCS